MKKFKKILQTQIQAKGVQALADRPNIAAQYGVGGLSGKDLKLWFDKLASFLADKINEIYDALSSEDAAQYIHIALEDYDIEDLDALVDAMTSGKFAQDLLMVLPSPTASQAVTLQACIFDAAKEASRISEHLSKLDSGKLDKISLPDTYRRAYIIDTDGMQKEIYIVEDPLPGAIPMYVGDGQINVAVPVFPENAANKGYVDDGDRSLGAKVEISIDPLTYIMTLRLKNAFGSILSTATVDLPLESAVVGGEYADGYLTLKFLEGETKIKISDIIDGLVSSSDYSADMEDLRSEIKKTNDTIQSFSLELTLGKVYAHAAFSAENAETARNYTKGGKIDMRFRECDNKSAVSLDLSLSEDYKLTVALKNRAGKTISLGVVDLPMQSLISDATCSNGVLTLKLQNGSTVDMNISDIVSGLVPEGRKINGKVLTDDIELTAEDVGAYSKDEVYSKKQSAEKISVLIDEAMRDTSGKYGDGSAVGYAYYSSEAEYAGGYIEGGLIDLELTKIKKRLSALDGKT